MTTVFSVIDLRRDLTGDQFESVFATRDDAIAQAEYDWEHLTANEQAKRVIEVWEKNAYEEGDEFDELTCGAFKLDGRTVYVSGDGLRLDWSSKKVA